MALALHDRREWWRGDQVEVRSDGECCGQPATLAHVGFELVAMTLAEPLRQAFGRHLDEHGCGDRDGPRYIGGFTRCEEAMRLWHLLPPGDRIVMG